MAETPEIPAVPAETPPAEAAAPRPEPSETSLDGAEEAAENNAVNNAVNTNETNWVNSESPAVVGSYASPAPTASAEAPAPAEAAPAEFAAGYSSAPPESAPAGDGASPSDPAAAPATTPGSVPGAESAAVSPAAVTVASPPTDQPALDLPAATLAVETEATAAMESEDTPAPPIEAPSQQPEPPGIATSVVVPPLPAGEAGEGGEWELLRDKVTTWFDGADLQGRWESLGGPLRAAGLLLAAVVLLRLYSALLETLGDLPLVPRLFQLVGLVCVVQFGLTRLVRSSEREQILTSWRQRWNDFRGRD